MNQAKHIPEDILASIQKLPESSWGELVDFIDYLQFKNSSKLNQDNQEIKAEKVHITTKIITKESEQIIEEILTEVADSVPSLDDYAVSRDSIYEDHP